MLLTHKDILLKLEKIEQEIRQQSGNQKKMEDEIQIIIIGLKQLLSPPLTRHKRIGFRRIGRGEGIAD